MKLIALTFSVLSAFALLASCGSAPEGERVVREAGDPITFGIVDHMDSKVLGERRTLNILLPPSYEESKKAYPVIYLLDGATNEDYHHVAGLVDFLTTYQLMPESILVGIANTDRGRDLTHATTISEDKEALPTGGGSGAFMDFLGSELQPYIETHYRAGKKKMVIGQSLGGLVATEILLTRNRLFDTYIIVSPSLWWADGALIKGASGFSAADVEGRKTVILSIGTEHPAMHEGTRALRAVLARAGDALDVTFMPLPKETHATILHRAIYGALESIYGDDYPGL